MYDIEKVIAKISEKNPNEPEFLNAIREVLTSVEPVLKDENYEKQSIIERITEPDRQIAFRVSWIDDNGKIQVNRGYRVQFNNALGPYKGGLRFHPSVNMSVIKFLAFEQIFKNALTGLPLGGGKGGSDFDPKGKSDAEIMRFCQSFMTELSKYIGADRDVPAGDIGVGEREIGYMFGQYKRLRDVYEGALTGKSVVYGGSLIRKQATGYGLVYFTQNVLEHHGDKMEGKRVCVSGAGNVATHAAEKAQQLGCKVLTLSDSKGWIYDENGVDLAVVKNIKENLRKDLSLYVESHPEAQYHSGKFDWSIPCDVALPCATQNELDIESAKNLVNNKCKIICEGANMPLTADAVELVMKSGILYAPGKAANAGGVAVSGLEMSQNSMRLRWTAEEVDTRLKDIMKEIFKNISETAAEYGEPDNYLMGANICGFKKVAEAIMHQGAV